MTHIVQNADQAWHYAAYLLKESGRLHQSRNGPATEVLGFSCTIHDALDNFVSNPIRNMSPSYAAAELLWYLSGDDSIDMIKAYSKKYEQFADNGVARGHYGARWRYSTDAGATEEMHKMRSAGLSGDRFRATQLQDVVQLLKDDPDTRQAMLSCWRPLDLIRARQRASKDIPCTVCLQFMVRESRLHCIVYMRSNDWWLGMPYDLFAFTCAQSMIAHEVGVAVGTYTHMVGSMHAYTNNIEALNVVGGVLPLTGDLNTCSHLWRGNVAPPGCEIGWWIGEALKAEKMMRETGVDCEVVYNIVKMLEGTMLGDLLLMCSLRHLGDKFMDLRLKTYDRIVNKRVTSNLMFAPVKGELTSC